MASDLDNTGGQGGAEQIPAPPQTSDTRLAERAIRERWPMPVNVRKAVILRLSQVIANPKTSTRELVSASRALIAADKLNLVQEERDNPTLQQHEHAVSILPLVERATAAIDTLRREAHSRGLVIDVGPGSAGVGG